MMTRINLGGKNNARNKNARNKNARKKSARVYKCGHLYRIQTHHSQSKCSPTKPSLVPVLLASVPLAHVPRTPLAHVARTNIDEN